VTIHPVAASREDGTVSLRLATDPTGRALSFAHTVLDRDGAADVVWHEQIAVPSRSLGSLVASGELPARAGLLKVDTEGHDLDVICGVGGLDCDVVVTEHWLDLPRSLGPCPWSGEEMRDALSAHGFAQFAFVVHLRETTFVQWNDTSIPPGAYGNLLFLHDRVAAVTMPDLLATASSLNREVVELAEKRLATIEVIDRERAFQTAAAEERRVALTELDNERRELQNEDDLASRAAISRLEADLATQTALATERLRTIELFQTHRRPLPRSLLRLRYEVGRIAALRVPRLGRLYHHAPVPLEVPAAYLKTRPPTPAPTISIVTPTFQHGRYLERTVRSVLDQRYPALEYFVQDGGSTDQTVEILRRYGGQLAGWASESDEGQADAINRAFRRTTGEIMGWLNSDDLLLPGALACVASYLASHPEVDVVYGDRVLIDDSDGRVGIWVLPPHDDSALSLADFVPQETLFWRRRLWEKIGGAVDTSFSYALDWDMLLRFQEAGAQMTHLPQFLGAFRVHDAQKTSTASATGELEMDRLRERIHGRTISHAELNSRLRPYLMRHVALHLIQRVVDRLPGARVPGTSWERTNSREVN
jgi:GT2 family glycosyltransferase